MKPQIKSQNSLTWKNNVERLAENEDSITLQQLENKFSEIAAQDTYLNTTYSSSAAIRPPILIVVIIIIYKCQ